MPNRLTAIFVFLAFCAINHVIAQTSTESNTNTAIPVLPEDTTGVWAADSLAYEFIADKEKAIAVIHRGMALAQKLKFTNGTGVLYFTKGNILAQNSDYGGALEAYQSAIAYALKLNKQKRLGNIYNNLCNVYRSIADYDQAILYQQKAIEIYRQQNMVAEEGGAYDNIAAIYSQNEQYQKAIEAAKKGLVITERVKDYNSSLVIMSDLSAFYAKLYGEEKKTQQLDSAFFYQRRAYDMAVLQPQLIDQNASVQITPAIIASVIGNLGGLYRINNRNDSAVFFLNQSIQYAREKNVDHVLCLKLLDIGKIHFSNNNLALAQASFSEALQLAERGLGFEYLKNAYENLHELEEKKGNYKKAYEYLSLYRQVSDSVYSVEKVQSFNNLQVKYETEKKQLEIIQLQKENSVQRMFTYLYLALALIAAALAFFAYKALRLNKKLSDEHARVLQQQKEKAELEKQLAEKENLATQTQFALQQVKQQQLEQDIDFSKRELLTYTMQLEKKNELIISLKSQLEQLGQNHKNLKPELQQTFRVLNETLDAEQDIEKFSLHFQKVHPGFFQKLQVAAENKLTPLDLKYCAYIKMNLGSKEISNLLNIDPNSFRVTRHRIKQKLNLEKETDLQGFLAAQ
jgi:DNA-binding CsgD family transcriptional regulator